MYNMLDNTAVLITRVYRKKMCSQVICLSDKRAEEWIKESKKTDLKGVKYNILHLWLV